MLVVIHRELTTYSRLSATLTHSAIASRADVNKYHLRRVIRRLVEVGALTYSPGHGPRHSLFALPSPDGERASRTRGEQVFGARAIHARGERANGTRGGSARPGRADITRSSSEEFLRGELLNHRDDDVAAPASNGNQRPRDELFDAMVEVIGWDVSQLTKGARGKVNAALKELRGVGATPSEIRIRAERYQRINPDLNLTPNALSAWWPALSETAKSTEVSPSSRYRDASVVLAEAEAEGL